MEYWKDIPGYEGLYQASSRGNIRSLSKVVKCKNGVIRNHRGRVIKPKADKDGYLCVNLHKNLEQKTQKVARLVAITFIDNPENLATVNHKNRVKDDNRISNLEWMTGSDNSRDGKLDRNLYLFKHPEHGEIVSTRYELRKKFNLSMDLNKIVNGALKTYKKWSCSGLLTDSDF